MEWCARGLLLISLGSLSLWWGASSWYWYGWLGSSYSLWWAHRVSCLSSSSSWLPLLPVGHVLVIVANRMLHSHHRNPKLSQEGTLENGVSGHFSGSTKLPGQRWFSYNIIKPGYHGCHCSLVWLTSQVVPSLQFLGVPVVVLQLLSDWGCWER